MQQCCFNVAAYVLSIYGYNNLSNMNPENYLLAKEILYARQCSKNELDDLKESYKSGINSSRRLASVKNVKDLIAILEKRDLLSWDNHVILNEISAKLRVEIVRNVPVPVIPCNLVLNLNPQTPTEQIHHLICNEIGKKWKDLARELEVNEGEIDNLEQLYPTIPQRVKEILLYYENNRSNNTYFELTNALRNSRRKDLANKVQKILSKN